LCTFAQETSRVVRIAAAARTSALRFRLERTSSALAVNTGDILQRIVSRLDQAGIPHMLTGSFASSYHGLVRATQDIDLVIAPTADQLRTLVTLLPGSDYYVELDTALAALREEGQFNVVDFATGWKIDLIIRKSRPFSRAEFSRRLQVDFQGTTLGIATVEDLIIAKLEWAKLGESQRQIEDVAEIMRIRADDLDRDYIGGWVERLQLEKQWDAACGKSG
jgi:hypothetical protein